MTFNFIIEGDETVVIKKNYEMLPSGLKTVVVDRVKYNISDVVLSVDNNEVYIYLNLQNYVC